jgi:hypothetical protein
LSSRSVVISFKDIEPGMWGVFGFLVDFLWFLFLGEAQLKMEWGNLLAFVNSF